MLISADDFDPSLEVGVNTFESFQAWKIWRKSNPWFGFRSAPKEIADHCIAYGIASVWFGHILPEKVTCATPNYRESLRGNGFNPRQRAVLEALLVLTRGRENEVSIYAAEGITPFAQELKTRYPGFIGSEYAPTAEDQVRIAPIEHQDLASLTYPDKCFDICVTNEVFEHLPDLETSLSEIHRVMRPGGFLLSTFPFLHNQTESMIKAKISEGEVKYIVEPEYHGNPVDPKGGALVFQIPGWEILDACKKSGFTYCSFVLMSSRKSGLVSRDYPAVFLLLARS